MDGDEAAGETVFANNCSVCHGSDGTGGTGPSMYTVVPENSDEEILEVVFQGSGGMAPVSLTDQEAADLLVYLGATFE